MPLPEESPLLETTVHLPTHPTHIGRYRIERQLGKGGFGVVYLAWDDKLQRLVVIKVPHASLIEESGEAEAYLKEARAVASLDHPHIVTVYDVGSADGFPCFVVSKFIDGIDLAARLRQSRMEVGESVSLVATVAEALHHAHRQGLVHRDVKPGNILLDSSGNPFVADFGLALREQDIGKGPRFAGTPAYMSPEQARGEGHRVDGRSDIFSLGVVLYEMLAGRRPFKAKTRDELLEEIIHFEVRPPRQIDESIPKELDRICLKALSKRASDRYSLARDLVDDLRHWATEKGIVGVTLPVEQSPSPSVGREVFISYASQDQAMAFRLCQLVEEQGVPCWIAPRNIPPGGDYAEAIIRAIEGTSTTILLLSPHSNTSIHVLHEIERATSKRKRVIPVRLENLLPSKSFEFHLASSQWLDAFRMTPEQVAGQLVQAHRNEQDTPDLETTPPFTPSGDSQPAKIVPKGLRSFDASDADFFLELVPGPRDRDGLPDSIRFWKTRLEQKDAEKTFSVGLIYGPSGCGKSSLVKAGLLPRLVRSLKVVYVEATGEETEARLLNGLRRQVPELPEGLRLVDALAALRQGQFLPKNGKVVLVIDQFEQWLHANCNEENTELVRSLRHCDGGRLQCVVMVRDDFWMAATRFMRDLEVRLLEGENSAAVDLFPIRHAENVLAAFGRANGDLPAQAGDDTPEQLQFVKEAVAGLAEESKVISVRLALFADMVKGKPWTPATLQEVGGAQGIGEVFLRETFESKTAAPQHRLHQKAAQAVLKAMLPETGADIKGRMRSRAELLEASGYANRPKDFEELLRILDAELRLITPTEAESKTDEGETTPSIQDAKYYQLTHDFLVPSLRDWLTRKQKETPRGRAELLLEDRAIVWNARPENRQLPSLIQLFRIRRFVPKRRWTPTQKQMMIRGSKYYLNRSVIAVLVLIALSVVTVNTISRQRANALVDSIVSAKINEVPFLVTSLDPYRFWADDLLRSRLAGDGRRGTSTFTPIDQSQPTSYRKVGLELDDSGKLNVSIALLPVDAAQVDYLYGRLLDAEPHELLVIREALLPRKDELRDKLWNVVEKPEKGQESQRLRAAAALALYDPEDERWIKGGASVVNDLVLENPIYLGHWSEAFVVVRSRLVPRLTKIFLDQQPERSAERSLATNLLANYTFDNPSNLAELLMNADAKQFSIIYPKFRDRSEQGLPILLAEIAKSLPKEMPSSDDKRETLAMRQANAAVALLRLNKPETVWPLLKHSPDPRVRSYIIHKLSPLGGDAKAILRQLDDEKDITIRRALLLTLGEFSEMELTLSDRQTFLPKLQEMYRTEIDSGIHSSSEWLLRNWEEKKWLEKGWIRQVNNEWAKDELQRAKKLQEIGKSLSTTKEKATPQWYVNTQGQTMVVMPGPVKFTMGSPKTEKPHNEIEEQHQRNIGRSFVIAAKSVTWEEYLKYAPEESGKRIDRISPSMDCPVNFISWLMAAKYCNWLSKAEGIPPKQWCFETNSEGEVTWLKENYLSLSGYRLSTEAEMEFVTRAGAITARYFGETDTLLPNYAWFQKNADEKSWPVGSKKPNDFGLFDAQGNVFTWCQERHFDKYPIADADRFVEDNEAIRLEITGNSRVLRGGSALSQSLNIRSATRNFNAPKAFNDFFGFRVARTFVP